MICPPKRRSARRSPSIRRHWGSLSAAIGSASCSCRAATARRISFRSPPGQTSAPNLERLLADPAIVKLFHFGRFDMGVMQHAFGIMAAPVYCTKIASKIARTYTDRHGLKDLTRELLDVEISKQQQSSDWGADTLSEAQLAYAASDVLHLHALREKLDAMLKREGRDGLARAAFAYLPDRVRLDLAGFEAMDVFSHGYP